MKCLGSPRYPWSRDESRKGASRSTLHTLWYRETSRPQWPARGAPCEQLSSSARRLACATSAYIHTTSTPTSTYIPPPIDRTKVQIRPDQPATGQTLWVCGRHGQQATTLRRYVHSAPQPLSPSAHAQALTGRPRTHAGHARARAHSTLPPTPRQPPSPHQSSKQRHRMRRMAACRRRMAACRRRRRRRRRRLS